MNIKTSYSKKIKKSAYYLKLFLPYHVPCYHSFQVNELSGLHVTCIVPCVYLRFPVMYIHGGSKDKRNVDPFTF